MTNYIVGIVALIMLQLPATAYGQAGGIPVPRDTARERRLLEGVKAAEGFRVTLFAGPPVAMYPTCLAPASDGALFVCVDPNLSLDAVKGRGRIIRLVDSNNDGQADMYTTFAQMDSPRGIAHDGRTLYVMHPPLLSAYRDTNGDGVADSSEVLVRGLGFDLDFRGADHTTNGITLAIDGWIYVAVGDYGYRDAVGKDGSAIQYRGGSIVRVRTDGTGLEMYAKGTRNIYDLAIDPFLNVFTRDNTNDGDGWDTRLHYIAPGANMGYPALYRNFASEHMPSLFDYGGGSGTAGLWVHDPGYPTGMNNTLYTGDWTVNRVFSHPLTPKGATYTVEQKEFLTIPHPSDMVMDGRSNMYVASLFAGNFTYQGDSVGYIIRVNHPTSRASTLPAFATSNESQLLDILESGNGEHRLFAQRELLRRGTNATVAGRLETIVLDRNRPAFARVAAMFTLKQMTGQRSHNAIVRAIGDPAIRAQAIRALTDNKSQLGGVTSEILAQGISDTNNAVRLQSINALSRLASRDAGEIILPLVGSDDPALAHIAVSALVKLNASAAALAGVDRGSTAVRRGALRALHQMHEPGVVAALISRARSVTDAATRRDIFFSLARLYNREAPWQGDWWGTRPAFAGPYFAPVAWDGSTTIKPVLRESLLESNALASASAFSALIDEYARNRVLPAGARSLIVATADSPAAMRASVVDGLLGSMQVSAGMVPLLISLDSSGLPMRTAVAQLLAAESTVGAEFVPLVRASALDSRLDTTVRGQLLTLATRLPGRPGLEVAFDLLSRITPDSATPGPIDQAWRRFVGDRRRQMELDYFAEMSRSSQRGQRTLAFAVLLQSIRGNRVSQNIRTRVTPVLDSTWTDRARATDLVQAITIMRVEAQYTERLEAFRRGGSAASPAQQQTAQQARATPNALVDCRRSTPDCNQEWIQLFNGRDLSNWDIKFMGRPLNENYKNTFRVEEGMLKVRYDQWTGFSGEFGHLFHKTPYSYYLIAAEYRFTGEQVTGAGQGNAWAIRNNGLMLHSQSAASMGERQDFPISLEVQLLGGLGRGPRTTANLCTPGTHVVRNDRLVTTHCMNSTSPTFDGDVWVRVEVLVLGDSILKHIVNGDTVFTYSKPQMGGGSANNTNPGVLETGKALTEGYIALQAETAPIDFRKVELLNLVGCMDRSSPRFRAHFVKSDPAQCR